jgi:membrane protease YdiL (CAAX protease family)
MKRSHNIGTYLSSQETISGFGYLAFQLLLLPSLLDFVCQHTPVPLSDAEVNFLFYFVNFIAILLIFHDFLSRSLSHALHHFIDLCQAVVLGFVAHQACRYGFTWVVEQFYPAFSNYNDQAMITMIQGNYLLMFIGTVILVPIVEECLYRGLIFRNLYPKSRWTAYAVSILAFTAIHILGYVGQYSALELLLAILQYLPAGVCLAWSYTKADTIFAPILIHAAINFIGINALR